jgi:hypothetical protein
MIVLDAVFFIDMPFLDSYDIRLLASITFAVWLGGSFPPRVFNQILKLLTFTVAGLSLHALNAQQSMATQHKISLIFLMFLWYLQEQIY